MGENRKEEKTIFARPWNKRIIIVLCVFIAAIVSSSCRRQSRPFSFFLSKSRDRCEWKINALIAVGRDATGANEKEI